MTIHFDPEAFGKSMGETVSRMIEPIKQQLATQQATISALCGIAQKHAPEYQADIGYRAGSVVRQADALYLATANALPGDEPGTAGDWQKIN